MEFENYSNKNRFAILQLSEADTIDRTRYFAPFDRHDKHSAEDYEISFFEENKSSVRLDLDDVYMRFNGVQPSNYYGHSLSVSDVILESHNDKISAYYVDSFGFEKLDDSFLTKDMLKRFDYGLDIRKEYEAITKDRENLQAVLGSHIDYEERKTYIEENYVDIFVLADERAVIINNQDKLKAIYEIEKDLPFPSVREHDGWYSFSNHFSTENKSADEMQNEIDSLYIKNKASSMTKEEKQSFIDGFEFGRDYGLEIAENEQEVKDTIALYEYLTKEKENVIYSDSKNINVITPNGIEYDDTFYVIDSAKYNGTELFLLESEEYGDEVANVIVDKYNNVVLEDVWNGFDDFEEQKEDLIEETKLDEPIEFKDNNGNDVKIVSKYMFSMPNDLKFVDHNNHEIEYMLGTVNISDYKLIVKTESGNLYYSSKLDEIYDRDELVLTDPLDVTEYNFEKLGNINEINKLNTEKESETKEAEINLEKEIGVVEAELLQEGEFDFSDEEWKKIVEGIKNRNTFIKLNELNSKFNDDVIIRLGKEDIIYDNDRECYAWFRDFDAEMEREYYTYFDIEDIKSIYIGEEEIRNYYNESEKAQLREINGIKDVAIESTEDFADTNFHKDLIDRDIMNEDGSYGKVVDQYRIVTISSDGTIKPLNDMVFASSQEARESIDTTKYFEINYDDMIYKAGLEMAKYKAEMERMNNIIDSYENKGFEFPNREEYSDKYIKSLTEALSKAENEGYSDKASVEYAKAKAKFVDVDKAIKSIPLVKNSEIVSVIDNLEFYMKKDNPNSIYTYDEEFSYDGSVDVKTACENIFNEHYKDITVYSELLQSAEYDNRVYDENEIIEAIHKEAGILDFSELDKKNYLLLDTETTGFGLDDEIIELGIIDKQGNTIYESLYKPTKEISEEASKVNSITNSDLDNAPRYIDELEKIVDVLENKDVVIFNKAFDTRMVLQTAELHRAEFGDDTRFDELKAKLEKVFNNSTYCAMQTYANQINSYKVIGLNNALKDNGIEITQSHRAVDDCKDTLKLINKCLENQKSDFVITPIQEFVKDGHFYTGSEVSGFHLDRNVGLGFADRSRLYNAVLDFQNANKDFPNLPIAIDENGNYEDKEFLYSVYDEYIALSHREELKEYEQFFDEYADNKIAYNKENNISYIGSDDKYISKLDVLAEVYYAKQNGLSNDDITYMIDNAKGIDTYLVAQNMRDTWRAFNDGLTKEQIDLVKDFNSNDREVVLSMIADGRTAEEIKPLKDFDYNVLYPMKLAYKSGDINTEQGIALCEGMKRCIDSGKMKKDYTLGYFVEGIATELHKNPQSASTISATLDKFIEQDKHDTFWKFYEENGWSEFTPQEEKNMAEETKELINDTENNELNAREKLAEKLKEGVKNTLDSENFAKWVQQQGKLYYNNYSIRNAFLTYLQNPNASYVCGYESWKDFGRQVSKGAKGIQIYTPVFIRESRKGELYGKIKNECNKQIRNGSEYAKYNINGTRLDVTMQKNGLFDLKIDNKTYLSHATEEQFKKFLDRNVIGKVPAYYGVATVFDIKDTIEPETLWVKKGSFKQDELVLNKNGEPIINRRGEYKIYNTEERKNSFNLNLDLTIKANDERKLQILYDTLKEVSENKGIPFEEKSPSNDSTLKDGARGYFKQPSQAYPNGNIVISSELPLANKVSTAFHEMAHADMHKDLEKLKNDMEVSDDFIVTRQLKEVQAESVAFMTASNFGIETDHKSFNYIATWSDGRDLKALEDSMKVIYNESKQLMQDIEKVLDKKGLDLSLSEKSIASYDFVKDGITEERKALANSYVDYALNGLRKNEAIQKEAFNELKHTENQELQSIIKEQIVMTNKAEEKFNDLYSKAVEFSTCTDNKRSVNLDLQLKALKTQLEDINNNIDKLSKDRVDIAMNSIDSKENDLKALYNVDSQKAFEILAENHSSLKDLSKDDMKFLANNEFIKSEYSKLLGSNNSKFVELATAHLDNFKNAMSKNNTVVEVYWCEQWTDKPIFSKDKGYLVHPALANKMIANAEKQMGELKKEAEKNDDYFPYTKCKLAVHSITELNGKPTLTTLVTRVDIGDGSQKDLKDHLEQILSDSRSKAKQQILTNFTKSVKERTNLNSYEATYYSDIQGRYSDDKKFDIMEQKSNDISQSMNEWKSQLEASNKSNDNQIDEPNKDKSASKDKKERE